MKITLDEATLSKAVISYLQGVGVQSDILKVDFRYTRVPYTVFAEVELAEALATKPARTRVVVDKTAENADETVVAAIPPLPPESLVDPDNLPPETAEDPEAPRPETPAAPLFGGSG
jgi:hypothetical protein